MPSHQSVRCALVLVLFLAGPGLAPSASAGHQGAAHTQPCPSAAHPDSDGDGLHDSTEIDLLTDPCHPDTDRDLLPDGYEVEFSLNPVVPDDATLDLDEDGLPAWEEYCYPMTQAACERRTLDTFLHSSTSGGNYQNGLYLGGTDPLNEDTDNDSICDGGWTNVCQTVSITGLDHAGEVRNHLTDPTDPDTDDDNLPDGWEVHFGLQPLVPDGDVDADLDGYDRFHDGVLENPWTNVMEYCYDALQEPSGNLVPDCRQADEDHVREHGVYLLGTDPTEPNADLDCLPDGFEAYHGTNALVFTLDTLDDDEDGYGVCSEYNYDTNPNDPDSDDDGLCDGGGGAACSGPEAPTKAFGESHDYGSNPNARDSDADGIEDGDEAAWWFWEWETLGTTDTPDADGLRQLEDPDSDGDYLPDGAERALGTSPLGPDTDGDDLGDHAEVQIHRTNATAADTDGDGLEDGEELVDHGTDPRAPDSDRDLLGDGNETLLHQTGPLDVDSDGDELPDGWEVENGTLPLVYDAHEDPDGDGLTSREEFTRSTHPNDADSDGDGADDGYEVHHGFDPLNPADADGDADDDGLTNAQEQGHGTDPRRADTDGDGLGDGREVDLGTDPGTPDSDGDDLTDGEELAAYRVEVRLTGGSTSYLTDSDPLVADTDGDGSEDGVEARQWFTDPRLGDTDDDGLSDKTEALQAQGSYSPLDWDTDRDGTSDFDELVTLCTTCDDDHDGLTNFEEAKVYRTFYDDPDSDDDGLCDGSERNYWAERWNADGRNRLLLRDTDGDSLPDGDEVGQGAYPSTVGYATDPERGDTDGDTLPDGQEERLVESTECPLDGATGQGQQAIPVPIGEASRGIPGVGLGWVEVVEGVAPSDLSRLPRLAWNQVVPGPHGVLVGYDRGPYVLGAFGVRMRGFTFPDGTTLRENSLGLPFLALASPESPCEERGKPTLANSDGNGSPADELPDPEERTFCLDPQDGDTDGDGLPDHLDGGRGWTRSPTKGDPGNTGRVAAAAADYDEDGMEDGDEDVNLDGVWGGSESNALDADTDDDGLKDSNEFTSPTLGTLAYRADTDFDGLSDGLEAGLEAPQAGFDALSTPLTMSFATHRGAPLLRCGSSWLRQAWMAFEGDASDLTRGNVADTDGDGILDGLEERHGGPGGSPNGVWGEAGELDPTDPDTDDDGLADGIELLMWGAYSFCDFHRQWGSGGESKLRFDPTVRLATDPRDADTDDDGVGDGHDVAPRADAQFEMVLDTYQQLERNDADCCDEDETNCAPGGSYCGWAPEPYFAVGVILPNGAVYNATTFEDKMRDWPNSRHEVSVRDYLRDRTDFVKASEAPAGLDGLRWQGARLLLDLYDSGDAYGTTPAANNCPDAVCLRLEMRDDDLVFDDAIDIYQGTGTGPGVGTTPPHPVPIVQRPDPCQPRLAGLDLKGNNEDVLNNGLWAQKDGHLVLGFSTTLAPFALGNTRVLQDGHGVGMVTPSNRPGLGGVRLGEDCVAKWLPGE